MPTDNSVTCTPRVVFEPETGYLSLRDGTHRQIVMRVKDGTFYVWWKSGKTEHPLTLDQLLEVYLESKGPACE
jgi:hypothetical protein